MDQDVPRARYDADGDLYAEFPIDLADSPTFPLIRLALLADIPARDVDWDPSGDCLFVGWAHARTVEARLRAMWPTVAVRAAANPAYGAKVPVGPRAEGIYEALAEVGR